MSDPLRVFHPVQTNEIVNIESVALRAYEVYCALHGCRGGFGARELIAFLEALANPPDRREL